MASDESFSLRSWSEAPMFGMWQNGVVVSVVPSTSWSRWVYEKMTELDVVNLLSSVSSRERQYRIFGAHVSVSDGRLGVISRSSSRVMCPMPASAGKASSHLQHTSSDLAFRRQSPMHPDDFVRGRHRHRQDYTRACRDPYRTVL